MGLILLMLVFMLPVRTMKQHVSSSMGVLEQEGDYTDFMPKMFARMHPYNISPLMMIVNNRGMARDNHTDALMLGAASFGNNESIPLLEKVLLVYHDESVEDRPIESLANYLRQGFEIKPEAYPRYWHGYLVVLKPLLLLFTYKQIRIINAILIALMYGFVCLGIYRRLGAYTCSNFIMSSMMTFPVVIPFCMQYCTMTYITLIAMNCLLWHKKEIWIESKAIEFFFTIGVVTAYFDFFTYPIIALGCLLILRVALTKKKTTIKETAVSVSAWLLGYGLMWAAKWVLASLFTSHNVILDAYNQIVHRTLGQSDQIGAKINAVTAVAANLSCYTNYVFIVLIIIIVCRWTIGFKKNGASEKAICYGFIMLLPIAWMIVVQNHSYDHSSFTYRSFIVSFWAFMQIVEWRNKEVII